MTVAQLIAVLQCLPQSAPAVLHAHNRHDEIAYREIDKAYDMRGRAVTWADKAYEYISDPADDHVAVVVIEI